MMGILFIPNLSPSDGIKKSCLIRTQGNIEIIQFNLLTTDEKSEAQRVRGYAQEDTASKQPKSPNFEQEIFW